MTISAEYMSVNEGNNVQETALGAPDLNNNGANKNNGEERVLSIYGYTNYRTYLRDFYQFKKQSSRGYSYRSFSKAAKFTSPNFLKLVIDGERNISNDAIEKFINALKLKTQMAQYFRALVSMNQAKTDEERELAFAELKKLTPHAKKRLLNSEEHQYLSHWLYPVLREMIELDEFSDDPYWIARRLNGKGSVGEIASALQFLITEGFIKKDADGRYKSADQMVISSDEVKSLSIRNYHRQMLAQAKETLETLSMEDREFGALTIALPESAIEELKFRLKTFRQETHQWAMQAAEDAGKDSVVQMNFQMYTHTKSKKTET